MHLKRHPCLTYNRLSYSLADCLPNTNQYENVQHEIDILRFLSIRRQPNIVSFKDILKDEHYISIVMELCEGGMVHDHMIENDTTFEEPRGAKMMKEIVCVLLRHAIALALFIGI